jgi:Skp family chaperone for outer membrane proteins
MGGRLARGVVVALGLALGALTAAPLAAQERSASPFLFINQERILTGSRTGQALLAEEEKARDALRADARAIDSAFEQEEGELNDQRATMAPDAFRKKADDFDTRVVQARQTQDERSNALAQDLERKRRQFYAGVAPILVTMMDRYGAHAIFDENSVLLADDTLNITEAVIAEIDASAPPGLPVPPAASGDSLGAAPASPDPDPDAATPESPGSPPGSPTEEN